MAGFDFALPFTEPENGFAELPAVDPFALRTDDDDAGGDEYSVVLVGRWGSAVGCDAVESVEADTNEKNVVNMPIDIDDACEECCEAIAPDVAAAARSGV